MTWQPYSNCQAEEVMNVNSCNLSGMTRAGLEPATLGLKVRCSTNWANESESGSGLVFTDIPSMTMVILPLLWWVSTINGPQCLGIVKQDNPIPIFYTLVDLTWLLLAQSYSTFRHIYHFQHLGLDVGSHSHIVPCLDSQKNSNNYVDAYRYQLAFIKVRGTFWVSW